jgi:hypothetical protein
MELGLPCLKDKARAFPETIKAHQHRCRHKNAIISHDLLELRKGFIKSLVAVLDCGIRDVYYSPSDAAVKK